ncbi:MAG: LemA family protein [Tannerellaceae bacterium]|jgi:LemA protein|nr:LemA family protein [Tannerellaceae bacterium]
MTTVFIIIGAVILIVAFWFLFTFNGFIAKNNRVKQTESSIDVMLRQRNDMIPNLVAAVQSYVGHENGTLTKIAELRAAIEATGDKQRQMELGGEISRQLADIKVAVESYPELKADRQFIRLEESIEDMELNLQAARRTFNAAAVAFNNFVEMFPSSLIASIRGYKPYDLIRIPETEKVNVDVKSLFKG